MRVGFTGPRYPSEHIGDRISAALKSLNKYEDELIVGGCTGVDELVARFGTSLGFRVHVVLPANRSRIDAQWMFYCTSHEEMPQGTTYMQRNDRLVELSDQYIGFPDTPEEELYSGTWATIRRARKKGIHVTIIAGEVLHEQSR